MKSSPKVRCHAVSTAVVQDQSLTSESPPWKPSRNPKEEDKGTAKEKMSLTQRLSANSPNDIRTFTTQSRLHYIAMTCQINSVKKHEG